MAQVNQQVVQQKVATVDLDSTIIESWKIEAKPTHAGGTGYQPMLALWAEMNVVLPRPQRLRYLIFNTAGKLVHHARQLMLRLTRSLSRFSNWQGALRLLPLPV